MTIRDYKNMSDTEFMRFISGSTKDITSIYDLIGVEYVIVKDLEAYAKQSQWQKVGNDYITYINGNAYNLLGVMTDNSNKKMRINKINLEDRIVLEDGFSYLLDMIELV